ncbi:MAG: hypothetical protein AAF497_26805, partial [Planctomycetota bacterium]
MLKAIKSIVVVSVVASLFGSAVANAGRIQIGMPTSTTKSASFDLNHDDLGSIPTESTTDVDISGTPTGGDGDPPNDVSITVDLGTSGLDTLVTGIGWDLTLSSFDPSWLSEATIGFNGGLSLSPAAGDDMPGIDVPYSSDGIVDLTAVPNASGGTDDLSFVATGGLLEITFFESFNDLSVDPDGL